MFIFRDREDKDWASLQVKEMCRDCPNSKRYPNCCAISDNGMKTCHRDDQLDGGPAAIETDFRYRG